MPDYSNYVELLKSDNGADFSEPIAVAYKEGYRCYDPCLWIDPIGSHVFKSNDNGKTISLWGTADMYQSCYDEHMVYEKKDGSLVMLIRTYPESWINLLTNL